MTGKKATLGQRLRTARIERELTLRQVAEQLDVTFSFIAQLERDERQPSLETLKAMAKLYGLSLDELAQ